ncbi:MAG: discoidin domain-containing protein [Sedimentisphaerales bacterium]|nr:discoidin domain-containing protein [Sedimentisphaerales bacterium]
MEKYNRKLAASLALAVAFVAILPLSAISAKVTPAITLKQIEADWLHQEELRNITRVSTDGKVTPQQDAIGACDGIKDGGIGFHTKNENKPWWQIDLGKRMSLERLVLYNRCDLPERTSRIIVLLSTNGRNFEQAYQHDGTTFFGYTDKKPLVIKLLNAQARYIRLQLPQKSYFHLDEVEIYAPGSNNNIALGKPATQSSVSQWSKPHFQKQLRNSLRIDEVIQRGLKLAESLNQLDVDTAGQIRTLKSIAEKADKLQLDAPENIHRSLYIQARRAVREMAFKNPLLDFDTILFVKRAPGTLPHMSDQYYGWWSRPGGGIYLLENLKNDKPRSRCLTVGWPAGSFLRPELSYDGKKVLFAYCRYYPHVAGMEKVDKDKLPEDAFYHIFEMSIDGTDTRQLTYGRYDDFDARYLPAETRHLSKSNHDIVFLSTRKGQFVQCSKAGSASTNQATLPDSYVRCGGDNKRPCAVFTLHAMDSNGKNLRPISAFENFEWTPSVAHDGNIIYARWDYIDRFNGHFMSLWSTNQHGSNPQLVYGNFTEKPQCIFEARAIPNSHKLIFTAAAHHSIEGGALALLDRSRGTEGTDPITRLTPDVCFPEAEGWSPTYYANPYPLSEQFYLVAWSDKPLPPHRGSSQVTGSQNPVNALGLYLYDSFGNLELLYRDPEISSMYPIPLRRRERPSIHPDTVDWEGTQEGRFIILDIYKGLRHQSQENTISHGSIKQLRIIGVLPKTQPHMNTPSLGVSKEDPGKFILGTVPVEKDGSAYFRVPSGIPVFFQALDQNGLVVQTMRSLTYVQPGQTLSCIGCHESREVVPPVAAQPLAVQREPSKITPGPTGSWPLRFDLLVQPVLDKSCVSCHQPNSPNEIASRLDLSPAKSYENLLSFADKDLEKLAFEKDRSIIGQCTAAQSKLLESLENGKGHEDLQLNEDDFNRLATWMDVYAQRLGSFSKHQEKQLRELRQKMTPLLAE